MIKIAVSETVTKSVVDAAILYNGIVKRLKKMYFGNRLVYKNLPSSFASGVPGTYVFEVPATGQYAMHAVGGGGLTDNDGAGYGESCAGGGSGAYAKTVMSLIEGQEVLLSVGGCGGDTVIKIGDVEVCASGGGGHGDVSDHKHPVKGVGGIARVGNESMINGNDGTATYASDLQEPECYGGSHAVAEYPYGRGGDCWFRVGLGEWEVTAPQNGFADISKID